MKIRISKIFYSLFILREKDFDLKISPAGDAIVHYSVPGACIAGSRCLRYNERHLNNWTVSSSLPSTNAKLFTLSPDALWSATLEGQPLANLFLQIYSGFGLNSLAASIPLASLASGAVFNSADLPSQLDGNAPLVVGASVNLNILQGGAQIYNLYYFNSTGAQTSPIVNLTGTGASVSGAGILPFSK